MLIFDYNDMLTELFFAVYGFSPGTGLYIFQNIGWRMTGNANGNFKLVTITQFMFCTWDIFHAIIVTNSSYLQISYKPVV